MNLLRSFRHAPNPIRANPDDEIMGWALHPTGRVEAIKQGSGWYDAGFGEGAFTETAFGVNVALSQSVFGWAAAYSVSTWVYRCIEIRKSAVHRMPWGIIDKRTKQPVPNHPLEIALKRNRQKLFKKIEQSQLLYGETMIEFAQNPYGYRSDLFWLNNLGMAVLVGAGQIIGYSYTAMQGGHGRNFKPDEVAFMKTDNPFNDLRGMSPTEVIMDEVGIDKDVARVVRTYYANDTRVGMLFIPKQTLLDGDAQRFMEFWNKQNKGVNKAGKANLMPYDMTVERQQEPVTLDDVELRMSTRREIAAGYGVPLSLAGAWDDANYQSLPEQRKSFYEETIIPECDNIADFINEDILPYLDDSGRTEFKYDYMTILALTEDAQKKNDIYSNRLINGLIKRSEARAALGHPVDAQADNVYYIPAGVTVVRADDLTLITPTTNQVQDTARPATAPPVTPEPRPSGPPELPAPKPKPLPAPAQPQLPAETKPAHKVAPQATALDELAAWEKKAINSNATKAATFQCYVIPEDVQTVIRAGLTAAGKAAPKQAIRLVFAAAKTALVEKEFDPNQARDEGGQWSGSGGGGGSASSGTEKPAASPEPPAQPEPAPASPQTFSESYSMQLSKDAIGRLDAGSKKAVEGYSGIDARIINDNLRGQQSFRELTPKDRKQIETIDRSIAGNALPDNTTLYRGFTLPPGTASKMKPGQTITDKTFVSTSLKPDVAEIYSGASKKVKGSVVMKINAPKGTKALPMSTLSEWPGEHEVLLPRNSTFKVTTVSKRNGVLYVDAEIA